MIMRFDVLFWLYSAQAVHCLSVSDKPFSNEQHYLTHTAWLLKTFWLELAKKAFIQRTYYCLNWNFLLKRYNFLCYKILLYTGTMLFIVKNNLSKIIWNWFLTFRPEIVVFGILAPLWISRSIIYWEGKLDFDL